MFKDVNDLQNYTDEQLYERITESDIVYGTDQDYEKYRDAKKTVREYEQAQREIALGIYHRLSDFEGEEGNDYVTDILNDFMCGAAGDLEWSYDYQEFWMPSNC